MRRISMGRLARFFVWIGLTSIGGGRAAYVYDAIVERLAWVSREEFLQGLTVSQLLPGPTITNLTVYLGHAMRGAAGAAWGLLAVVLPGAVAVLALGVLYFEYGVSPGLNAALRGMGAAVAGFILVTTVRMARGALGNRGAPWIAALTFATVALLHLNTVVVILLCGGLSLWLNRPGTWEPGRGAEPRIENGA